MVNPGELRSCVGGTAVGVPEDGVCNAKIIFASLKEKCIRFGIDVFPKAIRYMELKKDNMYYLLSSFIYEIPKTSKHMINQEAVYKFFHASF